MRGDGEGSVGPSELVIGGLGARALNFIDVWFLGRAVLGYIECSVAWVGHRLGGWNWARYVPYFLGCLIDIQQSSLAKL